MIRPFVSVAMISQASGQSRLQAVCTVDVDMSRNWGICLLHVVIETTLYRDAPAVIEQGQRPGLATRPSVEAGRGPFFMEWPNSLAFAGRAAEASKANTISILPECMIES